MGPLSLSLSLQLCPWSEYTPFISSERKHARFDYHFWNHSRSDIGSDLSNTLFSKLIRVCLGVVSLFSALVLIMGALVTNYTSTVFGGYFVYAAFAIAVSILTLATVPVMCVPFLFFLLSNTRSLQSIQACAFHQP